MSIDTTRVPVRRHEIPGLYNLRDTGGYRAAGGTSRWGKLYRSDAPGRIDDAGRRHLVELGIAHVVDLRGDDERRTAPSRLDGLGIRVHHLPVFDAAASAGQAGTRVGLETVYDLMIDERGAQLAEAVRVIADAADDEAVLVHCTAGKDRTGLVVALALSAAGVEHDEVVVDYAQTAENLRGAWAEAMLQSLGARVGELSPELVELVTASPAPLLDALLDRIDVEHGSVRDYLLAHGLAADLLDRLVAVLVD